MQKKQKIIGLIVVITVSVYLMLRKNNTMDYFVEVSTLPQKELWTIEYANQMLEKSFNIGIPQVKDEEALLELVKHAYQWDKNAMIQYVKIVENERDIKPSYNGSLAAFFKKYSYELVDKNGKNLETPVILDLPYIDFLEKLADKGYATPASYLSTWLMNNSNSGDISYKTLSNEHYIKFVRYIKYSIKGGYKDQEYLANGLLFRTGFSFKDANNTQLIKFTDINNTKITEVEKKEAIDNYKICALHGSHYCLLRLAEANYYGVGIEQNYKAALAWAQLSNKAYQILYESYQTNPDKQLDFDEVMENTIQHYNQELANQIKQNLDKVQIEQASELAKQLEQSILTWDYDQWASQREPIPPQP